MSEMATENSLAALVRPVRAITEEFGIPVRTAMQDDVNGAGWCLAGLPQRHGHPLSQHGHQQNPLPAAVRQAHLLLVGIPLRQARPRLSQRPLHDRQPSTSASSRCPRPNRFMSPSRSSRPTAKCFTKGRVARHPRRNPDPRLLFRLADRPELPLRPQRRRPDHCRQRTSAAGATGRLQPRQVDAHHPASPSRTSIRGS